MQGSTFGATPLHTGCIPIPCHPPAPSAIIDPMESKTDIRALDAAALETLLAELGEPTFRADQLRRWLWTAGVEDFLAMHNLSKGLRETLDARFSARLPRVVDEARAADGTRKLLIELDDGARVETVLMPRVGWREEEADGGPAPEFHDTACLSTMAGCPMGCAFCATAKLGLTRRLAAHEIAAQILLLRRCSERLRNAVFMGQGEPFENYEATLEAARLLLGPLGMGARRLTVSTCGVVPGIRRLAREPEKLKLAVSLNAPDDDLRDELMPVNRRWPLADLLDACREFYDLTGRRVTFEYVLLGGVNDAPEQARALVKLLHGVPHKLNLIAYNPVAGLPYRAPRQADVERFLELTRRGAYAANLRRSRGAEIAAACGQLSLRSATAPPEEPTT